MTDPSSENRKTVGRYPDGTRVEKYYPSGTAIQNIDSTDPLKVQWFDAQGNPRSAPDAAEDPQINVGKVPASLHEYPFVRSSYDHPFEQDPIFPPPRTLEERERMFGPRTNEYMDEWHIWEEYQDGTKYRYDRATGRIRIITRGYEFYDWGDEPPFFYASLRPVAIVCDVQGPHDYTVWKDGTKRVRIYPEGTTLRNFKDTEPVCEEWRDPDGNRRDPGSADDYPEPPRDDNFDPPYWNPVSR
jgi:hypothetical protein